MSRDGQDDGYDVVVVGSGAGGMAAALTCAIEGLSVVVIEKEDQIGGSTAISGGAVWIPDNPLARAMGIEEPPGAALTYLREILGNAMRPDMVDAFLASGPDMIAYFDRHTQVKFAARAYSPDYYPERPGAATKGRPIDPLPYDGRLLGKAFGRLKPPLSTFTVLGGMMVNVTDVNHLLKITRSLPSLRHGMSLMARYFGDWVRGWSRGTRLVLGNALAARLLRSAMDRNIQILTGHALTELLTKGERVTGVRVRTKSGERDLAATRGVVLATGGGPWDTARRQIPGLTAGLHWSMSPDSNSGDGIRAAEAIGGIYAEAPADPYFWAPVSVWTRKDGTQTRFPHLVWDRAKPGLIAVDGSGRRFVNEGASYHEFVRAMLRPTGPASAVPAHLVADRNFVDVWGLGLALPGKRPRAHLVRDGYLFEAATVAGLASQLGLPVDALEATIATYNTHVAAGHDPEFHKGSSEYTRYYGDPAKPHHPNLGPVRTPPFYAVKVFPGDIGSASGLVTDSDGHVLKSDGQPIPGLHACGNDMASIMGGHYPGAGITLGPALTFGYRAGMAIARGS